MRVADLMTANVADCSPEDSIRLAALRMNERRCGCLPVTVCDDGEKRLVGIVTDRDLACRAVAEGLDPENTQVALCMSFPVQTIARDADLCECAERFSTLGVRRLVVVDADNRCQGIISRADLYRFITDQSADEQAQTTPQVATAPSPTGPETVDDANHSDALLPAHENRR
ncbi:MAG: CBS domain-containing protein [Planctomycetes bacterium]|nr:CBS domain-containing protein [Planctomycetota bacterium]